MRIKIQDSPGWGKPWSSLAESCAGAEGTREMVTAQDGVAQLFTKLVKSEMGIAVEWDWRKSRLYGVAGNFVPAGASYERWSEQQRRLASLRDAAYRQYASPGDRIVARFML